MDVLLRRHTERGLWALCCLLQRSFTEFLGEFKSNSSKTNKDALSGVVSSDEAEAAGPEPRDVQRGPEAAGAPHGAGKGCQGVQTPLGVNSVGQPPQKIPYPDFFLSSACLMLIFTPRVP